MERLVTTAQAAQILGLSLQGVHYRIKHEQLKSLKKAGKTYVYISEYIENKTENKTDTKVEIKEHKEDIFKEVIKAKNEQIVILKKSIKWMRKDHGSEILRLEENQKRIIDVFNREIELLQSAFNEMRSIYKPQLLNKTKEESIIKKEKDQYISLPDFTLYLKKHNKTQKDIKLIILKAIQNSDFRFVYNKKDKKLLILNSDFSDLV